MTKKAILQFVLKNWKAILIVVLSVAFAAKTKHDYNLMQKAYQTQTDSVKAQIESDVTLGGAANSCRVIEAKEVGVYTINNIDYLGCPRFLELKG